MKDMGKAEKMIVCVGVCVCKRERKAAKNKRDCGRQMMTDLTQNRLHKLHSVLCYYKKKDNVHYASTLNDFICIDL